MKGREHEYSKQLSISRIQVRVHHDVCYARIRRKESFYSTLECIRNDLELAAFAHLGASETEGSHMYQTAAFEVVPILMEEHFCVP